MMGIQVLRQKNESQPYALERHEKDLRQRLAMRSDFSAGKDQEKRRPLQKVHREDANHLFFSHDDGSALDPPGLTDYL